MNSPTNSLRCSQRCVARSFASCAGQCRLVVGHDEDARTHLGHVGIGKAEQDAVRQHALVGHLLVGQPIERVARLFGRVLFLDVDRQRRKGGRHRGAMQAAERADHQAGRVDAAGPLIEMRIGAIGDQGVARLRPSPATGSRADRACR